MAIQNLAKVSTLSTSDLVAIFSQSLGADASATLGTLLSFLQGQLTAAAGFQTQYSAPNATAFTVLILPTEDGESVYLQLTPTAGFANGAITLPAQALCVDGQEVLLATTQAVAAFAVNGNGSVVNGAPTALLAGGFFRLRFDAVSKAWFRIG